MVYILVLILSLASGEQLSMLRSSDPMTPEACAEYIDYSAKNGALKEAIEEQAGETGELRLSCVPLGKDT